MGTSRHSPATTFVARVSWTAGHANQMFQLLDALKDVKGLYRGLPEEELRMVIEACNVVEVVLTDCLDRHAIEKVTT